MNHFDILPQSRDRLNNGRSWFPTQAHIVVEEFFEQERFTELKPSLRKQKIAQYAAEAVLPEGHMLWSGLQLLPAGAPLYKVSLSIRVIAVISYSLMRYTGRHRILRI
jgi:hypothetical protein